MPVRVGIDLVEVEEVRESIAAHGDRYIERVYTAAERSECGRDPRRLAARFAAKEAAFKALAGEGDRALPWHSIGVEDGATGRPRLRLTGAAAALAERRQARGFEVSLTEGKFVVAALVVAEVGEAR